MSSRSPQPGRCFAKQTSAKPCFALVVLVHQRTFPLATPKVLAMGDILPGGSVRDPGGRLTLDWLAVYRKCAPLALSWTGVSQNACMQL
jgi:hypothetical protein